LSRPYSPRTPPPPGSFVRINGKIRAREVRVIGPDGQQVGVIPLHEAISMARARDMDLVEVAPNAVPPVCRVIDYGKYRYELAKKEKESRKHQHANRVKEIQLSASISVHDFEVKKSHAIDFLCDDMKVKVTLRFRGREMAHQEFGIKVVQRLLKDIIPYGHPDADPKLVGKGLNVMISPLPRNKRAKNPNLAPGSEGRDDVLDVPDEVDEEADEASETPESAASTRIEPTVPAGGEKAQDGSFANNPFTALDAKVEDRSLA